MIYKVNMIYGMVSYYSELIAICEELQKSLCLASTSYTTYVKLLESLLMI